MSQTCMNTFSQSKLPQAANVEQVSQTIMQQALPRLLTQPARPVLRDGRHPGRQKSQIIGGRYDSAPFRQDLVVRVATPEGLTSDLTMRRTVTRTKSGLSRFGFCTEMVFPMKIGNDYFNTHGCRLGSRMPLTILRTSAQRLSR